MEALILLVNCNIKALRCHNIVNGKSEELIMAKRSYTIDFKLKVLNEVEKKEKSKTQICREFEISNSTLSTFLKHQEKIKSANASESFQRKRRRLRCATSSDRQMVEDALFTWFKQARTANVPISGPSLCEAAEKIAKDFNVHFSPNPAWLQRFKDRRGIVFKCVSGESKSVSDEVVNDWRSNVLSQILKDFSPDNVFNCDETGLFFRCVPSKTLALKGDQCSGGKKSKDRVTVLLCANMSGSEKLTPLVIGKSLKPRCFKNIKSLPVEYCANRCSWMTSKIFEEWLLKFDRRCKLQGRKIVLFLDNCPAHVSMKLDNIVLSFMPPNTSAKLQPCDQGIIANFKHFYRRSVLQKMIHQLDSQTESSASFDFHFTLLDAMFNVHTAWNNVTQSTIANSFAHAGFRFDSDDEPDEIVASEDLASIFDRVSSLTDSSNVPLSAYVDVDDCLQTSTSLNVSSITQTMSSATSVETADSESDDSGDDTTDCVVKPPSVREARDALNILSTFFMSRENTESSVFGGISKMQSLIDAVAREEKRQTAITDFFVKV